MSNVRHPLEDLAWKVKELIASDAQSISRLLEQGLVVQKSAAAGPEQPAASAKPRPAFPHEPLTDLHETGPATLAEQVVELCALYEVVSKQLERRLGESVGPPSNADLVVLVGWEAAKRRAETLTASDRLRIEAYLREVEAALEGKQHLNSLPDDAFMTHLELARAVGLPPEPLRSRLDRWRKENLDGWQQVTEPKARQPKYLYRVGAVRDILRNALTSN